MTVARKHIPQPVVWDQTSILKQISELEGALTALTNLTGNPSSDTRGVVVRNVRDHEIVEGLTVIGEALQRINMQLGLLSGMELKPGDSI